MAQAYSLIQAVTVGAGGAASIEFTNIPATYTDLCLKLSLRDTRSNTANNFFINFNGVTTNRTYRYLYGSGSAAGSSSGSDGTIGVTDSATATASTFNNAEIYIPNYAGNTNKSMSSDSVMENNATASEQWLTASLWSNTAAITSISIAPNTAPGAAVWAQHSTAYLYGIGGARATGGTITADSTYTYHTFTSTGSFTALENIKGAEVLLVAGGGGGGGYAYTGGGGAGGVLYTAGQSLSAGTTYTTIVGAGGSGGTATNNAAGSGVNGSNSTFSSLAGIGGGGGGGYSSTTGGNGGSGGGAGATSSGGKGTGTVGQGSDGGNNTIGSGGGAGGGGAGAAGDNRTSQTGANGGIGTTNYYQWLYATNTGVLSNALYYIAAGGGGGGGSNPAGYSAGAGGTGGGGAGSASGNGTAGTANTGGGGGGGAWTGTPYAGGAGGSGLVIIRYPN